MTKIDKELFTLLETVEGNIASRIEEMEPQQTNLNVRLIIEKHRGYIQALQDVQLYLLGDKLNLKIMSD